MPWNGLVGWGQRAQGGPTREHTTRSRVAQEWCGSPSVRSPPARTHEQCQLFGHRPAVGLAGRALKAAPRTPGRAKVRQ